MERREYEPRFTLEQITEQIEAFERFHDMTIPLAETEGLEELLGVLERRFAYLASRVMTGFRSREEQVECLDCYELLLRVKRMVAEKVTYEAFQQRGDTGDAKRLLGEHVVKSEIETLKDDYQERLRLNSIEEVLQWVAHRHRAHHVVPLASAALATTATAVVASYAIRSDDVSMSNVEFSLSERGLIGLATVMGATAIGMVKKSGPRRVGGFIGSRIQSSYKRYALAKDVLKDRDGATLSLEEILEQYARRDLQVTSNEIDGYLNRYEMNGVEDISSMVNETLKISERSMIERYGIDLEQPWYRQFIGYTSDSPVNALQYKTIV